MKKGKNDAFILKQLTVNYISFLVSGLVLLVASTVLVLHLNEFEIAVSQYLKALLIFMIVFAVLGLVLLLIGVFLAIKTFSVVKNIEIEEEYIIQSPQSTGLNIIRPTTKKTVEEPIKTKPSVIKHDIVEQAPEKKEVVKEAKKPSKAEESLPVDFTYEDGLQSIIDRYNTEKVKKAFKGWYNTMMMTFTDLSKSYLFKISGDEGLEFSEGFDGDAAVQVSMNSTIFVKMMTKQINPIKAYSSGNLEVKGEMKNMLKLRKLMF